jgi:cytidylate kinase
MSVPVLAIDGPSGVGKGTLAAWLAGHLGWYLLDSGALYRLTALAAQNQQVALDDEPALAKVAAGLDVVFAPDAATGLQTILLNQVDVTDAIRTETMGNAASHVAALPTVRAALLERQRAFRRPPGLVADGRDIGTVVFPDALVKLFLTASAGARAKRRYNQLMIKKNGANLATLEREIAERDQRDANRATAPLRPAADAFTLDTTTLTINQVRERALELLTISLQSID